MPAAPVKRRPQTRSITKSLANARINALIAPANPAVTPTSPIVTPTDPIIASLSSIIALVNPVIAPHSPIVTSPSPIRTPVALTRELTPTEIVYVDDSILRARFNSGPLAVPPEVVEAEAGIQANEGDELGFDDVYKKFGRRAKGASGQVYDIREVGTPLAEPITLVCKIIDCALDGNGFPMASPVAQAEAFNRAMRELHILEDLDGHPHIVHLHRWFRKEYTLFLVMPLASEGTLANYPMKISFEQALVLIAQVMDAVVYMHQNGYTHRDLKPANILLTRERRDLKAIVADFGISEHGETHTSKSGTQGFRAPEVLGQPTHDKKVDSWAIGLILWDMLFGTTYFVDDPSAKPNTINWDLIKAKKAKEVKEAKGSIAQRASNNLWSQVDDFLRGLLTVTPNERWSVEVARQDPLLQHITPTVATGRPSPAVTVVPTISSTEDTPVAGPSGPAHLSNGSKLRSVPNVSSTSSLLLEGPPTSIKRKREVSSPMAPPPEATATDNLVPNAKRRREKGRGKFCRGN